MKRIVGICLAICAACAQEKPPDEAAELRRAAYAALDRGDTEEARRALKVFADRFPDHPDAAQAALDHALTYPADAGEREELLAEIEKRGGWAARRAKEIFAASPRGEAQEQGAQVPGEVRPGTSVEMTGAPGRAARFRVFRIDAEAYRAALLDTPFEDVGTLHPISDNFPRKLCGEAEVRFHGGGKGTLEADLKEPGLYLVEEEDPETGFAAHVLHVGTLGVLGKALDGDVLAYAFDLDTGAPVAGATVVLREPKASRRLVTGSDGICRFHGGAEGWLVVFKDRETWSFPIEPQEVAVAARGLVHISTDRPVYRPGQTVHFKAVCREVLGRRLALPAAAAVRVDVRDPSGRVLQTKEHAWSPLGTLDGSFVLADTPPLGEYRVLVHVQQEERDAEDGIPWWWYDDAAPHVWSQGFHVAAYRKQELLVTVAAEAKGDVVTARIDARYFFGAPVVGARVSWSAAVAAVEEEVSEEPPWLLREPFGDPLNSWKHQFDWHEEGEPEWYGEEVAAGEGTTDASGACAVTFKPPRPGVYLVHADVEDSGRIASGSAKVGSGAAANRVEVGADRMFTEPLGNVRGSVRVTDASGAPVPGAGVSLVAFLWRRNRSQNEEYEQVFAQDLRTGSDGTAACDVPVAESGDLRLRARLAEGAEDRVQIRVAGAAAVSDSEFYVLPEKLVYRAGERMRFLVGSSVSPLDCLLTVEGDGIREARPVRVTGPATFLEVEARADYAPNVFVKVTGFHERECLAGGFEVFVHPGEVRVDVRPDRAAYAPREKATVAVTTTRDGGPVDAEVEVAVVDEAIYESLRDSVPPIAPFFFRAAANRANDFGASSIYDGCDTLRRGDPWSEVPLFGGQAEEAPEPVSPFSEGGGAVSTRSWFPDTLHWSPRVRTGPAGRAEVEVTMPDSLSRWRVVARAVAGPASFGEGRSGMLTRKAVVLRPLVPRFLAEGDVAIVAASLHNGLDKEERFSVRAEAEGVVLEGAGSVLAVPAGGSARAEWSVRGGAPGTAKLRFVAESAAESDAVEVTLPVVSRAVPIHAGASARVDRAWKTELALADPSATGARLEIRVTSGARGAVEDALPFLAGYPHGCVEQTMSRFLPAVVAFGALKRWGVGAESLARDLPDMAGAGLQRLYAFQHEDGGWGWWTNDDTDPLMTAYVVFGLATAREAGIAVDGPTLLRGREALEKMPVTPFGLLARAVAGGTDLPALEPATAEDRAYLVLAGRKELAAGLPAVPPARGDSDGVQEAALVLRALVVADPKDARIRGFVDWLLRHRVGGAWHSTLDSAYAVLALARLDLRGPEARCAVKIDGAPVELLNGRASLSAKPRVALSVENGGAEPVYVSALLEGLGVPAPGAGVLAVERALLRDKGDGKREVIPSGSEVALGSRLLFLVRVRGKGMERVMIRAPLAAGLEPGSVQELLETAENVWFGHLDVRDEVIELAAEHLDGAEEVEIPVYAATRGTFQLPLAEAFAMYQPDQQGFSAPYSITIR